MGTPIQAGQVAQDISARLTAIANSNPNYDADVERYETEQRTREARQREADITPALAMRRELKRRLETIHEKPARCREACGIIAKALARKYNVSADAANIDQVIELCDTHGNKALVQAACSLLDEPRDPNMRNVFAVLKSRLRNVMGGAA